MKRNQTDVTPFVDVAVRTVYEGELTWWWRDKVLHDQDYHIKVNDSMAAKVYKLERKYGVTNDTRYCCQWEGVLLTGDNRENIEAAAKELARHLARFKGIISLRDASGGELGGTSV